MHRKSILSVLDSRPHYSMLLCHPCQLLCSSTIQGAASPNAEWPQPLCSNARDDSHVKIRKWIQFYYCARGHGVSASTSLRLPCSSNCNKKSLISILENLFFYVVLTGGSISICAVLCIRIHPLRHFLRHVKQIHL